MDDIDSGNAAGKIQKAVFASDDLPAQLDDRGRFAAWHDIFESLVCCIDISKLPDHAFSARFQCVRVGGVQINRFDGTMSRIARTSTAIARGPDDDFCFLLNRGTSQISSGEIAGRQATLAPGTATLIRFDAPCETLARTRSSWTGVTVTRERLLSVTSSADDQIAQPLDRRRAVLNLLGRYVESIVELGEFENDSALEQHIGETIVDLMTLALGASRDAVEVARMRGLRAARLREILARIKGDFADPAFSSDELATGVGLSRRYVNDLLWETGSSFAERVLELRLQKARKMLADPRHDRLKISEIAFACGFNEVSYFNRCFRRRFGSTPTQYRGGETVSED